jgi:NAD(P)-dependent dehydrogenase (short-subunit alcohol dehydrogenase family)
MSKGWVVVTGASSGIGRAAADGLAARGWDVIATARADGDLETLRLAGHKALHLELAEARSVQAFAGAAEKICGGHLRALFNNAGYGQPGAVEDVPREALERQLAVNVVGTHDVTRRLLPMMLSHGAGRIVVNSSILGLVAMPWRGAYNASKFALEGLFDTLRLELHGSGVAVSLIEPGPVATRFRAHARDAFYAHIDAASSRHARTYQALRARLDSTDAAGGFTLPAESIMKPLIHALESPRPRRRYLLTTPAKVLGPLRNVLPSGLLDALLRRQ